MFKLGLCCLFKEQPIKFRTTTATYSKKLSYDDRIKHLNDICVNNSYSLLLALEFCQKNNIGAFRISSQMLPLFTHPELGYEIDVLPDKKIILNNFNTAKEYSITNDICLSFHPDQFVVLSSLKEDVVKSSLRELEYHALMANLLGADMINIHGGGVYGDKNSALARFAINFKRLKPTTQQLLTIENDDKSYTPSDLLPLCKKLHVPLCYDVHHHRCNPDELTIKDATNKCCDLAKELNKTPHFHLSSPLEPWTKEKGKHRNHADFIDIDDFPSYWLKIKTDYIVDIEAKAKELAVIKLYNQLKQKLKSTSQK